jgi:protein tyrosine/serine phosphatase
MSTMRAIKIMRNKSYGLSALLLTIALLAPLAYSQSESSYSELPNFHKVTEHLYRGGQPRPGGIKRLSDLGVKAIINLRGEDDLSRSEEKEATRANIRYFSVPMAGIGRPTDAEMSRVMAIIDAPENWPVFVHCKHGSDRTGTVMACYRISHDRWDGERATVEARKFGMSWVEVGMRGYISDYYRLHSEPATSQAGAPGQTSNK